MAKRLIFLLCFLVLGLAGSAWTEDLPQGLDLAENVTLSGTPTEAGTFSFEVTVQDSASNEASLDLSLTVDPDSPNGWVTINGTVTYNEAPLCAMVLANGQHMFSCSGDGSYSLEVPLDSNGQITLFSFVAGLAPFKQILLPSEASNFDVHMSRASQNGRAMEITVSTSSLDNNWVTISGNVTHNESAVNAMVLANGQYMFSRRSDGWYELRVPLDDNGQITLFGFAEGFLPHKHIFSINSSNGTLLQPEDFQYLGAFRLPGEGARPRSFEYGGEAMTFNPNGNPSGPEDGFPGSLFVMGHQRILVDLPEGNQVAEISIPVPVNSKNLNELNYAEFIQDFQDITGGDFFSGLDEIPRVGMQYLDVQATGAKVHITWGQHLDPEPTVPTHAWFDPDLSSPGMQGTWFIGNQSFYSTNDYLFEIPASWADENANGRYLATGRYRDGGWSGMGPALFAYRPWVDDSGTPAPSGTYLEETMLLLYENSFDNDSIERSLNGYQHPDEWTGGAWLTSSTGKSAVLFAGTKGTGAKYWYGFINPAGSEYPCVAQALVGEFTVCRNADGTACPDSDLTECQGHNDTRGWWSSRFTAQFILFDPDDLAEVASGEMDPWEPQPYASLDIDEHLLFQPPEWEDEMLGTGDQRRFRIGAAAFDRNNDLLYVLELFGDQAKPVVHVWNIQ